jgi:hypothetical protein
MTIRKYQEFTTDELRSIATLIAGRELTTQRHHDILGEIYAEIIIILRDRRTVEDKFQLRLE